MEGFLQVVDWESNMRAHWYLEKVLWDRPQGWNRYHAGRILSHRWYAEFGG